MKANATQNDDKSDPAMDKSQEDLDAAEKQIAGGQEDMVDVLIRMKEEGIDVGAANAPGHGDTHGAYYQHGGNGGRKLGGVYDYEKKEEIRAVDMTTGIPIVVSADDDDNALMEIVQKRIDDGASGSSGEGNVPLPPRMSRSNIVHQHGHPGAFSVEGIRMPPPEVSSDDEEDDEEHGVSAAVAGDLEDALVEALPVQPDQDLTLDVARPLETGKEQSMWARHGKDFLIGCLLIALVVGFSVGFAVGTKNTEGDEEENNPGTANATAANPEDMMASLSPSMAPTDLQLVLDLPDYTLEALRDPESPQSKAYEWLQSDPDLPKYRDWRRKQRFAMATLYFATNGENWAFSDHWLDMSASSHECDWVQVGGLDDKVLRDSDVYVETFIEFVRHFFTTGQMDQSVYSGEGDPETCDGNDRLRILSLAGNQLSGSLPNEIGFLTNLESLTMRDNDRLVGAFPTTLAMMTEIKRLHFAVCPQLQGPLPTEIGQMSNLAHIAFDNTPNLNGPLPSEMGLLTSLNNFHVHATGLSGSIPSEIGLLHNNLIIMDTRGSKFSGAIPSEFAQLSKLRFATLGAQAFTSTLPPNMDNMAELEFFDVSQTRISGPMPSELGNLTKAWMMSFDEGLFTGTIPTEFGLLSSINHLRFFGNMLSGTVPSELGNLTSLLVLAMHKNPMLSGTIPPSVCESPQWSFLYNCTSRLCGCECHCQST